jgi:hypothetical protein
VRRLRLDALGVIVFKVESSALGDSKWVTSSCATALDGRPNRIFRPEFQITPIRASCFAFAQGNGQNLRT